MLYICYTVCHIENVLLMGSTTGTPICEAVQGVQQKVLQNMERQVQARGHQALVFFLKWGFHRFLMEFNGFLYFCRDLIGFYRDTHGFLMECQWDFIWDIHGKYTICFLQTWRFTVIMKLRIIGEHGII